MTIPSPPITEAIAICEDGIAELILAFPEGDLSLVFIEVWRTQTGGGVYWVDGTWRVKHSKELQDVYWVQR